MLFLSIAFWITAGTRAIISTFGEIPEKEILLPQPEPPPHPCPLRDGDGLGDGTITGTDGCDTI